MLEMTHLSRYSFLTMSTAKQAYRPKAVLPAPSFKYGSSTYVALAYAKIMGEKGFTIQGLRDFSGRFTSHKQVRKSVQVLINNGSITPTREDVWKITKVGIQQIIDFGSRNQNNGNLSD